MSARDHDEQVTGTTSGTMDVADWRGIQRSPEFARLVAARRRLIVPSVIVSLTNPAVISIPLAFRTCIVGTLLSHEPSAEDAHAELRVRAESGAGAELASGRRPGSARRGARGAEGALGPAAQGGAGSRVRGA
ncbi:MAG: hypothetical protein ACR2ND_10625 [Solirubrobacteraceae bacterium]